MSREAPGPAAPRIYRKRNALLALVPAIVVLVLVIAVFLSLRSQNASRQLVGHTRLVLVASEHALSTLKDAETGQRGYLLTGEEQYLVPYQTALDSLRLDTAELRSLAAANPAQQHTLDTLAALIGAKLTELDSTIRLRRDGRTQEALRVVRSDKGRRTMDSIRALMARMQNAEWTQHALRQRDERRGSTVTLWLLILGGLVTILISYYLTRLIARHGNTMAAQADLIAEQKDSIESQMVELEVQKEELLEQQNELVEANDKLQAANDRLAERTNAAEIAEARATAASETKSRFLATMSHELRTPLNAILGYTDLLDSGIDDPDANTNRSYINRTRTAARHLLSLIDDVLSISRTEAGADQPQLESVRVGELLEEVSSVINPLARQKKLGFEVHCEVDGQKVMIDRRRVRQILINVIGNSVKFSRSGRVQMNVDCSDQELKFRIRDTGPGIPDQYSEKIFEPFWQAPFKHTGERPAGAGLGLSVSRNLARAMDGELRVEPFDGNGAEFVLTIPFVEG